MLVLKPLNIFGMLQFIPVKMDITWRVWRSFVRRRSILVGKTRARARRSGLTRTTRGWRYTVLLTNLVIV